MGWGGCVSGRPCSDADVVSVFQGAPFPQLQVTSISPTLLQPPSAGSSPPAPRGGASGRSVSPDNAGAEPRRHTGPQPGAHPVLSPHRAPERTPAHRLCHHRSSSAPRPASPHPGAPRPRADPWHHPLSPVPAQLRCRCSAAPRAPRRWPSAAPALPNKASRAPPGPGSLGTVGWVTASPVPLRPWQGSES